MQKTICLLRKDNESSLKPDGLNESDFFLATIEENVAECKISFILSVIVIHILYVRLLSFGTRVYYLSARGNVTSVGIATVIYG